MFTGLVEATGFLRRRSGRPIARIFVQTALGPLSLGESINVNGACLTVDRFTAGGFEADLSTETLERTTLGQLPLGSRLHLERATPLGGRLGGHFVLGHVDGIGEVLLREPKGDAIRFTIGISDDLTGLLAPKGSIAVDGVSLTLNTVSAPNASSPSFDVMLVPHTLGRTALGELRTGQPVNVEVDVLARYVARRLEVMGVVSGAFRTAHTAAPTDSGRGEKKNTADADDECKDLRILQKLRSGGFF